LRVSVSASKRRNGGFYAPVSASKISVPDSDVRDRFDDWVGGWQFGPFRLHHPVLLNRKSQRLLWIGRFCVDFRRYRPALSVSGDSCGLSGRFWPTVSASKNSVPRTKGLTTKCRQPGNVGSLGHKAPCSRPVRNYRGFNPRASNCWLHSAGASRSRSTPTPRGSRPSTAALTRSGARNASEMVMLTWRTLHFCRAAIC